MVPYPVFFSVFDIETSEGDVPEIEMTSNVETTNNVVDDNVHLRFGLLRLLGPRRRLLD
jgi:hypothetical protein